MSLAKPTKKWRPADIDAQLPTNLDQFYNNSCSQAVFRSPNNTKIA